MYIFTDACYNPHDDWVCGIGGMLFNHNGQLLAGFSHRLEACERAQLGEGSSDTIIMAAEFVAVSCAILAWQGRLRNVPLTLFIDNNACRDVLISAKGRSPLMRKLLAHYLKNEHKVGYTPWVARVPSPSNCSDAPSWQVRHPGVVASSVPPNYCLRNRSNYCYLNAVAVAVHWAVISSGSTPRDLGSFGPAIDVLNRLKQVELPGHATWKALLQGWRRPTQQHDVTELMSFVMDPRSRLVVGEWQARCIEPGHDTICDRGLTSPFISFAIRGHTTLQDALTAWHEQHYRHALCAPPKLLAIQLGRFCSVGRRTVKVRTPCVIPLEIAIPCFCDDLLECGPQLYRLCSGIVHIGDMATTGHYRPFCVHRVVHRPGYEATSPVGSGAMLGSYTLYDDDRPPVLNTAATDNLLRHNAYVVFYIRI